MEKVFNLKKVCSVMLEELNLAFGTHNIIRLKIDFGLSEQYAGDPLALTSPLKTLTFFLSNNIINGIIDIEINQKAMADDQSILMVNMKGIGGNKPDIVNLFKPDSLIKDEFDSIAPSLPADVNFNIGAEKISVTFSVRFSNVNKSIETAPLVMQSKRVLLAEDNAVNAMVYSIFMQDWGISTDVAVNGQIAVDKISEHEYDLVLMDIYMPELNGIDAIKKLRKFNTRMPVIVLSASSSKTDVSAALEAGANEYLTKPISNHDLYQVLIKFLKNP